MFDLREVARCRYQPPSSGQIRVGRIDVAQSMQEAAASEEAIWLMLEAIPGVGQGEMVWNRIMSATYDAGGGKERVWFAFLWWSRKMPENDDMAAREAWLRHRVAASSGDGFEALYAMARQYGWTPPGWLRLRSEVHTTAGGDGSARDNAQRTPATATAQPLTGETAAASRATSASGKPGDAWKAGSADAGGGVTGAAARKPGKRRTGPTKWRKRSLWV